MIGSVTKKRSEKRMETYDRICDQKRREKRNGNFMIGSVTENGGRREMETYDRTCDRKRREKKNVNL